MSEKQQLYRESFRCTAGEKESAEKEAQRRGMTFSQLVRLGMTNETKRKSRERIERKEEK